MQYDFQKYHKLKARRKHKLFVYSMIVASILLMVNITLDYLLTDHVSYNAIYALAVIMGFILLKTTSLPSLCVYRAFYITFILILLKVIIDSRPEQATSTYWAFLIIITIFTYENNLKLALKINSIAFLLFFSLIVFDLFSFLSLPYSKFNYISFLMIYIVLSAFVYIMVKNFAGIEEIIQHQSLLLQDNVDELKAMQTSLIESEKMSALGNLVASISHEINTPLGIALLSISNNQEQLDILEDKLSNKILKQSDLQKSIATQQKGYELILKNLSRANDLIGNFKQAAVDQSSESKRIIFITEYIEEIVQSMQVVLKKNHVITHINGPEKVQINTYPGPIYQIISNLINNSILHGFDKKTSGNINIDVLLQKGSISLNYRDDGVGVSDEILKKIYEPFVTTKRNEGGSGLGMNIVYNIVTQILEGEIVCHSTHNEGIEFIITFPYDNQTDN